MNKDASFLCAKNSYGGRGRYEGTDLNASCKGQVKLLVLTMDVASSKGRVTFFLYVISTTKYMNST